MADHFGPERPISNQKPILRFRDFQCTRFPTSEPEIEPGVRMQADPNSPMLFNDALTTLNLRPTLCRFCKGQKYNFTAYFHNNRLFHSPPHHLLNLVEKSYILKNNLQSLLITYVLHQFEQEYLQRVRRQIEIWAENVDVLVYEVVKSAEGFQVESGPLGDVKAWTKTVVIQMRDHVSGVRQMAMGRGRWSGLLLEFRELWERVWLALLQDQMHEQWA